MGVIPPWSDLPQELLSAIAEFLITNPIDILSFRSVCKSWCSSSLYSSPTLFPPLPLTTPSPPYSLRQSSYCLNPDFSVLSVTVIYALRPPIDEDFPSWMPRVWVLFLDQSVPGKVSIRQPFSKNSYFLPINFPRTLNFLDFHASELGRFYNFSYLSKKGCNLILDGFRVVHKVVLFSDCNGLVVAVVLSEEGKLGLFRLGSGVKDKDVDVPTQWEIIHDGKGFRFDDIVVFKGRVLGIDRRGRVYDIVIGKDSSTKLNVVVPPIAGGGGRRKRVVESLGRLHLVVRCTVRGENDGLFKVFKLNEGTKKWVEVKSIGDQTFFFGTDFSFSAPAELLHGSYGKNCILFKQNSFVNYSSGYDDNSEMFRKSESSKLRIGVWHLEDGSHLSLIGSHTGYSNLFWPPPSWIWTKDKSERLRNLLTALDKLQSRIPGGDKDKFSELALVDQVGALKLMREALKFMKETFNLKELLYGFKRLQQQKKSVKLHDQEGTSTLATEERPASADSDCDWFSVETNFNACILQFEENTSNLEVAIIKKKYCAPAE
ncbi:F-box protein SKIP23-like isoform X1 [Chenopodium quinoa]|uniref:F-box domain-containing protein n=1 Tax=Chenopodium quinoa TaxID=63459 RepID=A0A803KWM9_CHEQI|nr:F-box protein SKIP23-like isoform X1 [Chenopodium quinoa]